MNRTEWELEIIAREACYKKLDLDGQVNKILFNQCFRENMDYLLNGEKTPEEIIPKREPRPKVEKEEVQEDEAAAEAIVESTNESVEPSKEEVISTPEPEVCLINDEVEKNPNVDVIVVPDTSKATQEESTNDDKERVDDIKENLFSNQESQSTTPVNVNSTEEEKPHQITTAVPVETSIIDDIVQFNIDHGHHNHLAEIFGHDHSDVSDDEVSI